MPPTKIGDKTLSWIPKEQIEEAALRQIGNLAQMPFIFKHVAVMPDCHYGLGATVGSCIPPGRHHPRRRRRGHRLRHDRRPDPLHPKGPAR